MKRLPFFALLLLGGCASSESPTASAPTSPPAQPVTTRPEATAKPRAAKAADAGPEILDSETAVKRHDYAAMLVLLDAGKPVLSSDPALLQMRRNLKAADALFKENEKQIADMTVSAVEQIKPHQSDVTNASLLAASLKLKPSKGLVSYAEWSALAIVAAQKGGGN